MATIASLNVRLGLLSKDFEAQLKGVERTLQQTGQKFSRLGSDLTAAVSFPLAGLGIAALKSAGDAEALRLALNATMEDAKRSTEDARLELEALRQAALAPGLDFEQAVKASIRLQNVGFSAEKARAVIVELANAVALTGGTAEDLAEVTNQFAQMTGKGKIFQDDLKIILGRMPKLASIMKETFGTTTAEGINALGINARDFIDTVTAKMQELTRVSGGISNAIVNIFTGLKEQAARLGEEINKAFNIESTTGGIVAFAKNLVSGFANLDDSTKKLIVSFAGIALVTGPVLSIFGGLVNGATATVKIFRDLSGSVGALTKSFQVMFAAQSAAGAGSGLKFIATDLEFVGKAGAKASATLNTLTGSVLENTKVQLAATRTQFAKNAITPITTASGPAVAGVGKMTLAFKALGVAQRAALAVGAIGLIVGAIAAAITIYQSYSREVDKAARVTAAMESVNRSAADAISNEKVKVTELVGVIKDETATREEKQRALEALQAIAPKEFANLTIEKDKIYEVDKALDSYIDSLLRAAKAKSAFARLEEIAKLRSEMVETADPGIWQTFGNAILSAGNAATYAAAQGRSFSKNLGVLKEQLDAEEKAMRDVIKANSDFVDTVADTTDATNDAVDASKKKADAAARAGEAAKEAAQKTKLYADALKSIRAVVEKGDVLGSDIMNEQAREIESQIERLIEGGFKPYSKEVENLRNMLKGLKASAGAGFITPNATQNTLIELQKIDEAIRNVGREIEPIVFKLTLGPVPTIPSLAIPGQVVSQDTGLDKEKALRDAKLFSIDEIKKQQKAADEEEQKSAQELADRKKQAYADTAKAALDLGASLLAFSKQNADNEISALEESYAAKFKAAQGNAEKTAQLEEELADKKAAINKKVAKQGQLLAIASAIVNTAEGVTRALSSSPPPFNFILAGLTAAAGAVEIATIKSQKFAKGGVVHGPTFGLVGEYPGAATNPEIIAPENKLRQIYREESAGAGGGQLVAIVKGDDLQFILDRASARRSRTR